MNMVTMFTCQKENAPSREETRKLSKKHLALSWTKLPEKEWENKP